MLLATLPTFFSFSAGWATFEAIFRASNQSLGRPVPTAMIGGLGLVEGSLHGDAASFFHEWCAPAVEVAIYKGGHNDLHTVLNTHLFSVSVSRDSR